MTYIHFLKGVEGDYILIFFRNLDLFHVQHLIVLCYNALHKIKADELYLCSISDVCIMHILGLPTMHE